MNALARTLSLIQAIQTSGLLQKAKIARKKLRSMEQLGSFGQLGVIGWLLESPEIARRTLTPVRNMSSARGAWPCLVFRHPDESYFVQCRASYDVTRTPAAHSHCYKLE